jgi:hypothetical protein
MTNWLKGILSVTTMSIAGDEGAVASHRHLQETGAAGVDPVLDGVPHAASRSGAVTTPDVGSTVQLAAGHSSRSQRCTRAARGVDPSGLGRYAGAAAGSRTLMLLCTIPRNEGSARC